jgi:pyruvate dehydrogenase E2 component (dihydrolipoamide acetyltransferase)
MTTEIKIPNLGESVESGDVLEILVSVGDQIKKDQPVVELETDKATVMVPATAEGVVQQIHCAVGETVSVGAVIVTISPSGAASPEPAAAKSGGSAETPAKTLESSPPSAKPGTSGSPAPGETASPAPAAPAAATARQEPAVQSVPAPAGTSAKVSTPVSAVSASELDTDFDQRLVPAGPAIRRFAREVGVDLARVQGTGENGRITREDVLKIVRQGAPVSGGTGAAGRGPSDGFGPVHVEKMPKIRQTIARKMHESWTTCPRVTNFDDADVTALEDIRQKSKNDYANQGIKLTTMPFLIKAVAMSLKSHPIINASIDMEAGQIVYKDYVNIGIAVDTDRGLVVPVLRNADKLSIPEIARQLGEMADGARDNDFSVDQLKGGTFTISNLGAIGGTYSTPIINTPETAILLAGRARKLPVVTGDDQIGVRLMMPLSLSYDHRLIDGGAAARFLNDVISYLEAPSRLLLAL